MPSISPLGILGVLAMIVPVAILFSAILFSVSLVAKSLAPPAPVPPSSRKKGHESGQAKQPSGKRAKAW